MASLNHEYKNTHTCETHKDLRFYIQSVFTVLHSSLVTGYIHS